MRCFLVFLSLLSGILICDVDCYLFGLLFLFLAFFLLFYKKYSKKVKIISTIFFAFGIVSTNFRINSFQKNSFAGIVIKRKDNYLILFDGIEKFYVKNNDSKIDLYDLVRFNGDTYDIHFISLESEFDFGKYLNKQGINREIIVKTYDIIIDNPINIVSYQNIIISRFSSAEGQAFASSILFNEGAYNNNINMHLRRLMLSNLLALTGTFITLIIRSLAKIMEFFVDEKKSRFLSLLVLSPYLLFTFNSLTTRRVVYFQLFNNINKNLLDKKYAKIEIISLIGLIFLISNPFNAFQFSFYVPFTILFILNFSTQYISRFRKFRGKILSKIIVYLILTPFIANIYGSYNFLSILFGILLLPVFKFIYIILILTFYGLYFDFFNKIIEYVSSLIYKIDYRILDIYVPEINQYILVIYFSLFIFSLYFLEIGLNRNVRNIAFTITVLTVFYVSPLNYLFINEVHFINVGQGDSTLITYQNEHYLIDTGGLVYKDIAQDVLIKFFKKKKIYSIDYLFITHNDYDHSGAVESLCKNFNVKNVYKNNYDVSCAPTKLKFEDLNKYKYLYDDENDKSLVLKFEIADITFLLMGDASIKIEQSIISDNKNLDIDVLKIGHHGSKTSTCKEFIDFISPSEAIISCGYNNKYDHPNDTVIKMLKENNIVIRRTDYEGTISYKFNRF